MVAARESLGIEGKELNDGELGGTPGKLCLKGRKSEREQNERIEWRAREGGAVKKLHCNFRRNARKAMLEGPEIRTGAE